MRMKKLFTFVLLIAAATIFWVVISGVQTAVSSQQGNEVTEKIIDTAVIRGSPGDALNIQVANIGPRTAEPMMVITFDVLTIGTRSAMPGSKECITAMMITWCIRGSTPTSNSLSFADSIVFSGNQDLNLRNRSSPTQADMRGEMALVVRRVTVEKSCLGPLLL